MVETYYVEREHILTLAFILDDKKITYFRTYKNILNIIADVSGILKVLLTLGSFIVMPISEMLLNLLLVNSIF
jgi:hypothetical protein